MTLQKIPLLQVSLTTLLGRLNKYTRDSKATCKKDFSKRTPGNYNQSLQKHHQLELDPLQWPHQTWKLLVHHPNVLVQCTQTLLWIANSWPISSKKRKIPSTVTLNSEKSWNTTNQHGLQSLDSLPVFSPHFPFHCSASFYPSTSSYFRTTAHSQPQNLKSSKWETNGLGCSFSFASVSDFAPTCKSSSLDVAEKTWLSHWESSFSKLSYTSKSAGSTTKIVLQASWPTLLPRTSALSMVSPQNRSPLP